MTPGVRQQRTRVLLAAIISAIVFGGVMPVEAERCGSSAPSVNKMGFRPGATISFQTAPAPDGMPFPAGLQACVTRAFDAWTTANAWSGSWVRFTPGPGGIVVRFDSAGGLVLPPKRGGAWTGAVRADDGFLEGATVWLTRDPGVVSTCHAVTKVMLHELGHLHGLADIRTRPGRSVMNALGGGDDRGGRVPMAPTRCDAAMAAVASFMAAGGRADSVSARR